MVFRVYGLYCAGEMRITFWNSATRDNVETTQCGWLTVSGRDIFISSH